VREFGRTHLYRELQALTLVMGTKEKILLNT
jgi:hypothetical protein